MAAPRTVTALRAFVAIDGVRYTTVAEGEQLPASAPVVKAHPSMFTPGARPNATRRKVK